MNSNRTILRIFEVRAKPNCAAQLLENFSTTSGNVVKDHPGSTGYFFGRCVQGDDNIVMFTSIWRDLDAVKERFGENWQSAYLPAGYEDLIEDCTIRHFDVASGWHMEDF